MLPQVLCREVEEGLGSYSNFGFEASNPDFSGIVRMLASQAGNLDLPGIPKGKRQALAPMPACPSAHVQKARPGSNVRA